MNAFQRGVPQVKRRWIPDCCSICDENNCLCLDERAEDAYYQSLEQATDREDGKKTNDDSDGTAGMETTRETRRANHLEWSRTLWVRIKAAFFRMIVWFATIIISSFRQLRRVFGFFNRQRNGQNERNDNHVIADRANAEVGPWAWIGFIRVFRFVWFAF